MNVESDVEWERFGMEGRRSGRRVIFWGCWRGHVAGRGRTAKPHETNSNLLAYRAFSLPLAFIILPLTHKYPSSTASQLNPLLSLQNCHHLPHSPTQVSFLLFLHQQNKFIGQNKKQNKKFICNHQPNILWHLILLVVSNSLALHSTNKSVSLSSLSLSGLVLEY